MNIKNRHTKECCKGNYLTFFLKSFPYYIVSTQNSPSLPVNVQMKTENVNGKILCVFFRIFRQRWSEKQHQEEEENRLKNTNKNNRKTQQQQQNIYILYVLYFNVECIGGE